MSQIENSKRPGFQAVHCSDLEIRISILFRISKFELRISKGKLDHFVNFRRDQEDLVTRCLRGRGDAVGTTEAQAENRRLRIATLNQRSSIFYHPSSSFLFGSVFPAPP